MASGAKSFLADAGYGEQELDANSALMELDKGREKQPTALLWQRSAHARARSASGASSRGWAPRGVSPGPRSGPAQRRTRPAAEARCPVPPPSVRLRPLLRGAGAVQPAAGLSGSFP